MIQQIRNCEINGFSLPEAFVHDRDGIYGMYFNRILLKEFGVIPITIGYKMPWQQGKVERYHLTLKTEILYRIPIADDSHVRELCTTHQHFYNSERTHQSLKGNYPRNHDEECPSHPPRKIEKTNRMGGLVTIFREAA